MSTPAGPTPGPPALLTPDQFTVIVACCSSLVLFVLIVAMLSVIYRKDARCCKVPPYRDHRNLHTPPQYYSSRQALMGSLFLDPDSFTQTPEEEPPRGPLVLTNRQGEHGHAGPRRRDRNHNLSNHVQTLFQNFL
ncbi:unnamed protein product [Arctogadus glacialis]